MKLIEKLSDMIEEEPDRAGSVRNLIKMGHTVLRCAPPFRHL